jgi:hypothetical protein
VIVRTSAMTYDMPLVTKCPPGGVSILRRASARGSGESKVTSPSLQSLSHQISNENIAIKGGYSIALGETIWRGAPETSCRHKNAYSVQHLPFIYFADIHAIIRVLFHLPDKSCNEDKDLAKKSVSQHARRWIPFHGNNSTVFSRCG